VANRLWQRRRLDATTDAVSRDTGSTSAAATANEPRLDSVATRPDPPGNSPPDGRVFT
jgi:hypothetical protein